MDRQSNYDKFPYVPAGSTDECSLGWAEIANRLKPHLQPGTVFCMECYPGVFTTQLCEALHTHLQTPVMFCSEDCLKSADELHAMLDPLLGRDRVFGRMSALGLEDYFDSFRLGKMRIAVERAARKGPVIVLGTGALFAAPSHPILVYADLARWEIQLRLRHEKIGNLGLDNATDDFALKYKCGFFAEWRAADRLKKSLLPKIDFLLDTNLPQEPKLISGDSFHRAIEVTSRRPFRVVPYFDPGPWGGHWMEKVCDLPHDVPNHAWCFDCVPEENSLLLGFGERRVEIPSIDLVFMQPRQLLGDSVYERFGAEFPIRFDFLDTVGGGNLSLQVHPLTAYIREKFGLHYTQDESYYLLDAEKDASVYLGLNEGIDPSAMLCDLRAAQDEGGGFDTERYVHKWPARKHDHFLIPAGTVHCSGAGSMVLEISATPYIFTFKLWDWGRLGLNGRPRPIHIDHGAANIQWDRTTKWVKKSLINRVENVAAGEGWREERTGLHELEFIETRRHWFTGIVPHDTKGTIDVINLVQGEEAIIESPTGAFQPFVVHYAETFIVPAQIGSYTIRPYGKAQGTQCATMKAFIRNKPDTKLV